MALKNPRFTQEQRQRIAKLHDEIDSFNLQFYTHFQKEVVFNARDFSKKNFETKSNLQTAKLVYRVDFDSISEAKRTSDDFTKRMLEITFNIEVRSVRNKIIQFFPNGRRISLSVSTSGKKVIEEKESLLERLEEINLIQTDTIDSFTQTEREAIISLLSFMNEHNEEYVVGKSIVDRFMFRLFSKEDELILAEGYYRGGIVIPMQCIVNEPRQRKKRNDRKANGKLIINKGNRNYILDKDIQYGEEL